MRRFREIIYRKINIFRTNINDLKNKSKYSSYRDKITNLSRLREKYNQKLKYFFEYENLKSFFLTLNQRKIRTFFFIKIKSIYNTFDSKFKLTPNKFLSSLKNLYSSNSKNNSADLSLLPPPPVWSRIFIWTLSSGSLILIAWATFTTIEETIILSGELTTVTPEVKVSSKDSGRITQVLVTPNQYVESGMILIIYEDEETTGRLNSLKKRLIFNQNQRTNLFKSFDLKLEQFTSQIDLLESVVARYSILEPQGAVSTLQLMEKKADLKDLKINYKSTLIDKENALSRNSSEMEEILVSILELEAKVNRFKIKSPVDGYIQTIKYQSPGERILSNDVIITIVPDKELIAQASIPSKVSAPIQIGMSAKVEVDAYPSSDFGAILAEVDTISPTTSSDISNSKVGNNQRTYKAEITLISPELPNKLNISELRSGMAITAKIKLRDKPIIASAFNIISDIFDPLAEQR